MALIDQEQTERKYCRLAHRSHLSVVAERRAFPAHQKPSGAAQTALVAVAAGTDGSCGSSRLQWGTHTPQRPGLELELGLVLAVSCAQQLWIAASEKKRDSLPDLACAGMP